ncbi:MAG: DUF4360 domain-containing protein [Calothrix sp. MO_167.B12]|nr:DUF4360 domain-containing protein [Calothrix sp. MO_167.B12]
MNIKNFRKTSINFVKVFLATATLLAASVAPALAQPQIVGASYTGSGCPPRSPRFTRVIVNPSGQVLTFRFRRYVAHARRRRTRNCNLMFLISVPPHYQITSLDALYRGYVAPQTQGRLRADYLVNGIPGPVLNTMIHGERNYSITDGVSLKKWTRCGRRVNMRVNTSMTAYGESIANVGGIRYRIRYRKCQ